MSGLFGLVVCAFLTSLSVPDDTVSSSELSVSTDRYFYERTMPVCVTAALSGRVPEGAVLSLELENPEGKCVFAREKQARDLKVRFEVPAGLWTSGNGKVSVSVKAGTNVLSIVSKSVRILRERTNRVRALTISDGVPHLNGSPYFARFVHYFGPLVRKPDAAREEILSQAAAEFAEMREMGINTVIDMSYAHQVNPVEKHIKFQSIHEGYCGPVHRAYRKAGVTYRDLCELASKFGISVMGEIPFITCFRARDDYSQEEFDCFADEISCARDCENVILWHPEDECDDLISQNLLRRRLYAEADPERLAYANFQNDFRGNCAAAEILSADPYPISPNVKDLFSIAHDADEVRKVVERPDRAMFFWIQNYGDEPPAWPRPPTPVELRAMTYLALNHGAKGLGYFNYFVKKERLRA